MKLLSRLLALNFVFHLWNLGIIRGGLEVVSASCQETGSFSSEAEPHHLKISKSGEVITESLCWLISPITTWRFVHLWRGGVRMLLAALLNGAKQDLQLTQHGSGSMNLGSRSINTSSLLKMSNSALCLFLISPFIPDSGKFRPYEDSEIMEMSDCPLLDSIAAAEHRVYCAGNSVHESMCAANHPFVLEWQAFNLRICNLLQSYRT